MYSQNNEEEIILNYFGDHVGRFLDIGAYDGVTLSNTRALALKGWRGMLIEPSPSAFLKLIDLYGGNEKMELLNCAVCRGGGLRRLFYETECFSTIEPAILAKHTDKKFNSNFMVNAMAAYEIQNFGFFAFISIDIEGTDWEVAKELVEDSSVAWKASMIIVEHAHHSDEEWSKLFANAEHTLIRRTPENFIFTHHGQSRHIS